MPWQGAGEVSEKPRYNKSKRYVVEVRSKTLYQLLKKPVDLDRIKTFIEHSENCMAAFLRGFFDSEGSVNKRGQIHIVNTDLVLLMYVKDLLQRLGVVTTGPRPSTKQGRVFHDPVTGKRHVAKKDCYYLYIRASSNITFYRKMGFTIQRKRRRLEGYLRRRQAKPPSPFLSPSFKLVHYSKIITLEASGLRRSETRAGV